MARRTYTEVVDDISGQCTCDSYTCDHIGAD